MRRFFFPVLLSVSCAPIPVEEEDPTAICDGVLQLDEGNIIDSTFDKDGDGFKDKNEAACHDVYDPAQLDCDDNNPNIRPNIVEIQCNDIDDDCNEATPDSFDNDGDTVSHCTDCDDTDPRVFPGNTEVCWDNVDNDCDAIIDNDCGGNYNGNFLISPAPSYVCGFGPIPVIDINFDEIAVIYSPPYLTMYNIGGVQPGSMDGTVDPSGYFYLQKQIILPGDPIACSEEYRLFGTFTDADHFDATLQANYKDGFCGSCSFQEWTFTGTRIDETTY